MQSSDWLAWFGCAAITLGCGGSVISEQTNANGTGGVTSSNSNGSQGGGGSDIVSNGGTLAFGGMLTAGMAPMVTTAGGTPSSTIDYSRVERTCGNGKLDPGEQCDDRNRAGGDGCTAVCQLEADALCPAIGQGCLLTSACGDGIVSNVEACDDGNTKSGDGCSADCLWVQDGWYCGEPGKACQPPCSDSGGIGVERCADGTCSAECTPVPFCGDAIVNGSEACDNGAKNGASYGTPNGCNSVCQSVHYCGDGIIDARVGEECDEGVYGDRYCSGDCKIYFVSI